MSLLVKFTHPDNLLHSKHCTLCHIDFTLPFIATLDNQNKFDSNTKRRMY